MLLFNFDEKEKRGNKNYCYFAKFYSFLSFYVFFNFANFASSCYCVFQAFKTKINLIYCKSSFLETKTI